MDHCNTKKRKINPREDANVLSLFTFGYTLGLFKKGFKKDLEEDDLFEVIKSCGSKKCGDKTEKQWNKSHSIYKLLWKRFGVQYTTICLINIAWKVLSSIIQPYAMSRLIAYFQKGQTKISQTEAYYYAGVVVFFNIFAFLFVDNLLIYEFKFGTQIRASLKSLLYRKALKLSPASFSDTNLGNIVTILTKDIHTIEENLWLVMDLVMYIIQTLTIAYLLWAKMGDPAFIGLGLLLVALPIQAYLSTLLMKMRLKVGENADQRLQVTQETLSAIKIIKMYTWEKFFNDKISEKRRKEMYIMMRALFINFFIIGIGVLTSKLTFLVLILAYIWMGYTTTTELIFYVLSQFNQLTWSLGVLIPMNLSKIAEFRASFIRFNKLLQAEEISRTEENLNGKPSIVLKDVSVSIKDKEILQNISLKIIEPSLTLITGVVGSGKSSLLKTILQDYARSKGEIEITGSVSYASQDPWLFPSSIKQNILFGQSYNPNRYEEVIRVCALKYDLALLETGDETVVADRGINLSKGQQSRINLARAVYKNSDIYLLDDSLTALDSTVQDFIYDECIKKFLKDKIVILVTQNANHLETADNIIIMDQGKILLSGKPDDIHKKKLNGITQGRGKESSDASANENLNKSDKPSKADFLLETEQQFSKKKVYHETKKSGKVELSIYKKYFQYGGGLVIISIIFAVCIVTQVCQSISDTLITNWIDLQQKVLDLESNCTNFIVNETYCKDTITKKDDTFMAYTILVIVKVILLLLKWYALLVFCRTASINIHRVMSSRVVNAVMSFFDTHFLGNILNRFSHDMNNIDEGLPHLFPGLLRIILSCIGAIIVISTVNWTFLIPACVLFVILVLLRKGYMPTGRSLKRLEAATRSPLVGHINSSLEGLTTIRAFKQEQILKDEFDRHQDLYTSAYFTLLTSMTAFGFFMDFYCVLFIILVIVRFLFFPHDLSAGKVGLAITQVFMLTTQIQYAVKRWAELENLMTSVERALEYTNIKQENHSGGEMAHWPSEGAIEYERVTLKYENSKDPVLRNINFSVRPKQKIGIVGRTGAGKSSIISTLFRMYEFEGKIWIDGVDIKSLSLSFLRRSMAIIPQDPVLFTGTIRDNLDPNRKYSDDQLWKAIEQVKIKDLVPSLDLEVTECGSSFSAGQRQLICVARAALGKYKIVVLDEATANMDAVTDKMLHGIIEDIFSDCTILTIAHRLPSILNCDMVMVLDKGELVEFDNPRKLLQEKSAHFYRMCQETDMEL